MPQPINVSNGKWQTVVDLENAANELEENLEDMNKSLLRKILIGLNDLMNSIKRLETGIFNVVLKWFRLYLNVHISINPDDTKLLKYFENTVPTVITYVIGCLQYKTKELPDYHYKLLEILEQLLENVPTKILANIANFEIGTIGCLWNPINIVGDFNTQLKALKVLALLLKQFDDSRQMEELKHIKWTNLNLFQDKLKTIVQETKLSQHLENATRELLNNFNMNLSKSVLVYSFYCQSLELGNRYTFYKPLNLQNFWIDINYTPKTLSYTGRFKLYSKSRYENINVIVKIQTMKLENSVLHVHFKQPGEFSKNSEFFTNLQQNIIKFHLPKDEELRLKENDYIMEYFNKLNKYKSKNETEIQSKDNVFDSLKDKNPEDKPNSANSNKESNTSSKNDNKSINLEQQSDRNVFQKYYKYDSPPEKNLQSAKTDDRLKSTKSLINLSDFSNTSKQTNNEVKEHSTTRKLRDRKKFFTTLFDEDSEQEEFSKRKGRKKKSQCRKPRQSKSRSKQVCKVTPTIDLTNFQQNEEPTKPFAANNINNSKILIPKCSSPIYTTQECNKILKNVADIYNVGDTTYAKPCQSYRKFKTDLVSNTSLNNSNISSKRARKKKNDNPDANQILTAKKCRDGLNKTDVENKENINPSVSKPYFTKIPYLGNSKLNISTNIFESQNRDIITPNIVLDKPNIENSTNLCVDLTFNEENLSNLSFECEEVRGINERSIKNSTALGTPAMDITDCNKLCTPRPTSAMNISDFNDSDMELTQINLNFITNENEQSRAGNSIKNVEHPNAVQQIIQDFAYSPKCLSPFKNTKEKNVQEKSIALQTHSDNKESFSSSSDEEIAYNESNKLTSLSKHAETIEMPIKKDFIVMHSKPIYYFQQNSEWRTPVKNDMVSTSMSTTTKTTTKCQVTPTAVVMHQIQVSTRKSLIFKNSKPTKFYTRHRAKKNLNGLYAVNQPQEKKLINLEKDKLRDTRPLIINKDGNNNNIIIPSYTLHKENNFKDHQTFENIHVPSVLEHHDIINYNDDNNTSSKNLINLNETLSALDTTQVLLFQEFENEHINGYDSELLRNCTMNESSSSSTSTVDELMLNDLHEIINNYNKNIQIRLENAHHHFQSNVSDIYAKKFTELLQAILQKSDRQKFELERLISNIGRLVKQIQTEYETFMRQTKEYDINREVIKHILENFSNIQSIQTQDYEYLTKQLNNESSELLQKLLKIFLEKKSFE